jgi:hypothetical protein
MELIRIWDLDRRGAIAGMELKPLGSNPAVTPDGGTLLFWSLGSLTRMPLDARQWATHLCRTTGRDLTDAERQILPPGSPTIIRPRHIATALTIPVTVGTWVERHYARVLLRDSCSVAQNLLDENRETR